MKWKTTLLLLIATVGIGTYISRYEIRQPTLEEQARRSQRVLNIPQDAVTQLQFRLPSATLTFARADATWTLAPHSVRADDMRIAQLLSQLEPLEALRVLSGSANKPLELKSYGLDPAVGEIICTARGTPTTLLIGSATPVHKNRYAKLANRPEVFVIEGSLFDSANQSADTFRDPLLLHVNSSLVDAITLTTPTTAWTLTQRDHTWRLTQPLTDRASQSNVDALTNGLGDLHIKRFINDTPAVEQLTTWGLDQPTAEIHIHQSGGTTRQVTLFFGKPLPEDHSLVYAKRSDELSLYAVSEADVVALLKDLQQLREKTCFHFTTDHVTKLAVTQGETHWTIERTGASWREAGGTSSALDTGQVEHWLNQVAELQLRGFIAEAETNRSRFGLAPPKGVIAIWTRESTTPQQLFIGHAIGESTDRYGHIEGRTDFVKLPAAVTALLAMTPAQLRTPLPPAPPQHSPENENEPEP